MKLTNILGLFALCEKVNSVWWAATIQPVILSIGTLFAALDLDFEPILDVQPIEWRKFLAFKKDKKKLNKGTPVYDKHGEFENLVLDDVGVDELLAGIEQLE